MTINANELIGDLFKEMGWTRQDWHDLWLQPLKECPVCKQLNEPEEEECVTCGEALVDIWEHAPEYCECCGAEL